MQINLIADSSVAASAPAGFAATIQAAAAILDQDFPGNYAVNITYGWGTIDNQPSSTLQTFNGAEGTVEQGVDAGYGQLSSWLTANATLSDQQADLASLPANNAAFPGAATSFFVSGAEEKALGVFSGNSSAIDGAIGFGLPQASEPSLWLALGLHELTHALGRIITTSSGVPSVMDLYRFSAPGVYEWSAGPAAYVSFDGGTTDLANYDAVAGQDYADFDGTLTPADPFNYHANAGSPQTLTSIDIQLMNAIGFGAVGNVTLLVSSLLTNGAFTGIGGHDTVSFDGASTQYTITNNSGTSLTVTDTIGHRDGTHTLTAVEALQFTDRTIFFESPANADVALLYQGALDRTPDPAGLFGWENIYAALPASAQALGAYGLSDVSGNYNGSLSIAAGFTQSAEFIANYGTLTPTQFVTQLYANILDRAPDPAGLAGWLAQLSAGASQEHVLVGFADSQEAINNATLGFTGQTGTHASWLFLT